MDGMKILEQIIEHEGSCCWATSDICTNCPLGNMVRSDNGEFISCVEALNIDGLSEQEADTRYKEAATLKLADMVIDQVIEAN